MLNNSHVDNRIVSLKIVFMGKLRCHLQPQADATDCLSLKQIFIHNNSKLMTMKDIKTTKLRVITRRVKRQ